MRTAIVSVSDKTHLDKIGRYLVDNEWTILSSGGTFRTLQTYFPTYKNIKRVEDLTGFPEILGGRVKTLHPKIHGGILALSSNPSHLQELRDKDIPKIEMVVVNLYPFQKIVSKLENDTTDGDELHMALENIDIGGHTLIRAAAKNYKDVLVITHPEDYSRIINKCDDDEQLHIQMARKAWDHVARYDMAISTYFNTNINYRVYNHRHTLKYGCNPHQTYSNIHTITQLGRDIIEQELPFKIINGTLGYINILDAVNSWQLVCELGQTLKTEAAASFKHTSPAGVGIGYFAKKNEPNTIVNNLINNTLGNAYFLNHPEQYSGGITAYLRARNADPMSSFGDFLAFYGCVNENLAKLIKKEVSDGIIALDFTPGAIDILKQKKKGKYIILKGIEIINNNALEYREIGGFCISQTPNKAITNYGYLDNIVTHKSGLTEIDKVNLIIANTSLKYAQSNSVAYAYDGQLIGLGAGQQSRVDCVKLAGRKADIWFLRQHPKVIALHDKFVTGTRRQTKINACIRYIEGDFTPVEKKHWNTLFTSPIEPLTNEEKQAFLSKITGVAVASDAFFPFRDNIDHCSKHGVSCIIQPGGSIADTKIIDACNEYNMVMAFSNNRVFTH